MAKLLYSATMSLDGFIAGPGGDMSWLTEYLGPNPLLDELITRIGAVLAGACVLAAPMVILFIIFQRHFVSSDIGSGVKG